jgi:hypothetical protein
MKHERKEIYFTHGVRRITEIADLQKIINKNKYKNKTLPIPPQANNPSVQLPFHD